MMKVLQNKGQIIKAREQLIMLNASCLESIWRSTLRRFGLVKEVSIGDTVKSWDVLETIQFLELKVGRDDAILDIGSFASEVIVALHRRGFIDLSGVDLNPDLHKMPYSDKIHYQISDFTKTPFKDASFQAITSISVIEHGFSADTLLKEVSRLLRTDGYFIASFDYWPNKIDTSGVKFFDMSWLIFSRKDIENFVQLAASYNLFPAGRMYYESDKKTVDCEGKKYTFGWLVLQKNA